MSEYIDLEFKPNIKSFVGQYYRDKIERLEITSHATPVSSLRKERVAVWFGTLLSNNYSFGIIAASFKPDVNLTAQNGSWYYGFSTSDVLQSAPNPYEIMVDSATQPADNAEIAITKISELFETYEFGAHNERLVLPSQVIETSQAQ